MSGASHGARRWLTAYLRPEWRGLGGGAVVMGARAGVLILLPWPLKFIIDAVILQRPLGSWMSSMLPDPAIHRFALLGVLSAAMLLLRMTDAGLVYLGNRLFLDAAQRIGFAVRRDFFAHLQRLSLDFHRRHMSGDLVSRIGGDVKAIQDLIVAAGIDLLPHVLTIGGMLAVMLAMNWRYGLLTLAVAPILAFVARHFARRIRGAVRKVRRCEGAQLATTQEVLGNVQLVHAFAREDHEDRRFAERARGVLDAGLGANRVQAGFAPTMSLIIAAATGLIAWYGAVLVIRGALTAGDLLVFLAYLRGIAAPARQLAKAGRVFGRAAVALERVDEYRREQASIADAPAAVTPPHCTGHVELRDVAFGYRPRQPVVSDVSFTLERGKTVALVGATGSGKSTVAGLLARLHDPTLGQVLLDGRDLRQIRLRYVRTHVALVPQEPMLFQAPIWMNIAYGRDGAGRSEAIEAAVAIGLDDMLAGLADGYDTIVGERGLTLSGGQRQSVAIARAMLSEAAVVIFDEPSSSLDALTEQRVLRALRLLAQDRAALMIAHRLASVASADLILVLDRGRIVQRGSHAQLSVQGGVYGNLWRASGSPELSGSLRLVAS